jgi:hypothetical protein
VLNLECLVTFGPPPMFSILPSVNTKNAKLQSNMFDSGVLAMQFDTALENKPEYSRRDLKLPSACRVSKWNLFPQNVTTCVFCLPTPTSRASPSCVLGDLHSPILPSSLSCNTTNSSLFYPYVQKYTRMFEYVLLSNNCKIFSRHICLVHQHV